MRSFDTLIPALAAAAGVSLGLWWLRRGGVSLRGAIDEWIAEWQDAGLSAGLPSVRARLDAIVPPATDLRYGRIMSQRERMAALALVGDAVGLRRELEQHRGSLLVRARVDLVGWLGLVLLGERDAAGRLSGLADTAIAELGFVAAYVKRTSRALRDLAVVLANERSSTLERSLESTLEGMTTEGPLVAALLWRARLKLAERSAGDPRAERLRRQLGRWTALPPTPAANGVVSVSDPSP